MQQNSHRDRDQTGSDTTNEDDHAGSPANLEHLADRGVQEAKVFTEQFARANPRLSIGIALGVGFVLGGGLTPRLLFGAGLSLAQRALNNWARERAASVLRETLSGADHPPEGNRSDSNDSHKNDAG